MKDKIIIYQNADTLFSAGLKSLLETSRKYTIQTAGPGDLFHILNSFQGALLLMVWTEANNEAMLAEISNMQDQSVFPPILIITESFPSISQIRKLLTYENIGLISSQTNEVYLHEFIGERLSRKDKFSISRDIQSLLIKSVIEPRIFPNNDWSELTSVETKIVELAKQGFNLEETAKELLLSKNTVAVYRSRILKKTEYGSFKKLIANYDRIYSPRV